jgi:hypothetical protein
MNPFEMVREALHPSFKPGMDERDAGRLNRERKQMEDIIKAVETLCDALNSGNKATVVAGVTYGLLTQHRYLEDEAIVALLTALGEVGKLSANGDHTDARNEFGHKLCQIVRERFHDELFWGDK